MKYKIGDKVKSFFGNGIIKEYLQKDMNLYKIELSEGEHKGKMPWFAEHELEIVTTKLDKLFENFNDNPDNYKVSIDWGSQEEDREKATHDTIYKEIEEMIINPGHEGEEKYITMEEKEKRRKNVLFGIAIGSIEGPPPSKEFVELAKEYIDGKKEVGEIVKTLVEKYTEKS